MEQIIKFGISNYLQLCVEAGFSQIQSHIYSYYGLNTEQLRVNYKTTTVQLRMNYENTTAVLQMVTTVLDTIFMITFTAYYAILYTVTFFGPYCSYSYIS